MKADINVHFFRYDLIIEDVKNAEGVFDVHPRRAVGRYEHTNI